MTTNKYLVIGALPFTYMGTDITKIDGISTVVPTEVEGLHVYLQNVSNSMCYTLRLTEEYKNLEQGEWKGRTYWTYGSYGKWELSLTDISVLYTMRYVPRNEHFISLPFTQDEQKDIEHPLFSVSFCGNHDNGHWNIEWDNWKPVKD